MLLALSMSPLLLTAALAATPADPAPIEIGTTRGVPGQAVRGWLKVAEAADGTPVSLPLVIVTGMRPGPVVWLEAGAHGDEYGGPRAMQELVRSLDPQAMSGTVVAVMIANPFAFRALQRVNPNLDDLMDFGDAFPGKERFATERIGAAVTAEVKRVAQYFVDFHTGGDRFRQQPFVFYSVTGTVPADRYDELARGFGVPTLWRDTQKVFSSDATTIFSAAGIPSFLLEVGGGQPLEAKDVKYQADAARSFLRAVGVLAGEPARPAALHPPDRVPDRDERAGRLLRGRGQPGRPRAGGDDPGKDRGCLGRHGRDSDGAGGVGRRTGGQHLSGGSDGRVAVRAGDGAEGDDQVGGPHSPRQA